VGDGQWARVLEMVKKIRAMDMEVCTTLGMLQPSHAADLRAAGLTAYNHNLDTSPEYYAKVTSTRRYEDRLETLKHVREAGISVCAGGIIGLGEGEKDRVGLILQLATLPEHPESVPINSLVAVAGTPFEAHKTPSGLDLVRVIATARITMPKTVVRLSAGRMSLSPADQVTEGSRVGGDSRLLDEDGMPTSAPHTGDGVHGGRQQHLHRRHAAHDAQQLDGRRRAHVRDPRPQEPPRLPAVPRRRRQQPQRRMRKRVSA